MICSVTLNYIVEHTPIGSYRHQHHSWFVDRSTAAFIFTYVDGSWYWLLIECQTIGLRY